MASTIVISKAVKDLVALRVLNGKHGDVRILIGKKIAKKKFVIDWNTIYNKAEDDNVFHHNSVLHCVLWVLKDGRFKNRSSVTIRQMAEIIHRRYSFLFAKYSFYRDYYPYVYHPVRNAMIKACKLAKVPFNGRILVSMPV